MHFIEAARALKVIEEKLTSWGFTIKEDEPVSGHWYYCENPSMSNSMRSMYGLPKMFFWTVTHPNKNFNMRFTTILELQIFVDVLTKIRLKDLDVPGMVLEEADKIPNLHKKIEQLQNEVSDVRADRQRVSIELSKAFERETALKRQLKKRRK